MKRLICLAILISALATMLTGCYNTERHARRCQESFENIFLDGTGVN